MRKSLQLSPGTESLLRSAAEDYGLDGDAVVKDVARGFPAARLLLELAGHDTGAVKRGRPRKDDTYEARYRRIGDLVHEHGRAHGLELAAKEMKLSEARIRKIFGSLKGDEGPGRVYFDPEAVPPEHGL